MVQNKAKSKIVLTILIAMLVCMAIANLFFSYQDFSLSQMVDIFRYKIGVYNDSYDFSSIDFEAANAIDDEDKFYHLESLSHILFNLRLPSIIMCILVGLGLGSSGAILQGLFRNPLVDPGFIGVSSGAGIGAIIGIMFGYFFELYFPEYLGPFLISILAMTGSFITTIMVYKMSKVYNKTNIMVMLLSGIAINALAGSIIGFLISISSDEQMRMFTFWGMGNLESKNWIQILISSVFILCSFFMVLKIKKKLDIFMLGDAEAYQLGLNVEYLKKKIIVIASVMVGISVAFCGMIGFIGLVTPHLIRLLIGPKHNYLIPCSALLGSILILLSELIAKKINIPIGVITSAIGAPFFIWLIFSQKGRIGYSE